MRAKAKQAQIKKKQGNNKDEKLMMQKINIYQERYKDKVDSLKS